MYIWICDYILFPNIPKSLYLKKIIFQAWEILDDFRNVSGMKLTLDKTQGVKIGDAVFSNPQALAIRWYCELKILSIMLSTQEFPD